MQVASAGDEMVRFHASKIRKSVQSIVGKFGKPQELPNITDDQDEEQTQTETAQDTSDTQTEHMPPVIQHAAVQNALQVRTNTNNADAAGPHGFMSGYSMPPTMSLAPDTGRGPFRNTPTSQAGNIMTSLEHYTSEPLGYYAGQQLHSGSHSMSDSISMNPGVVPSSLVLHNDIAA